MIQFELVYDLIKMIRVKADEDDLDVQEALDLLEKELVEIEYDD